VGPKRGERPSYVLPMSTKLTKYYKQPKFEHQYDSCNVQRPSENGKKQGLMCKKCAWRQRMCKNGN